MVNDTVKEQLNKKSIKYNWHEADVTVLEGVLARGDRKIGQAILKVYEKGGIFDAWSEYFDSVSYTHLGAAVVFASATVWTQITNTVAITRRTSI